MEELEFLKANVFYNLKNLNDGHIYHVITYGIRRMWPHASQVNPEERWKIVHYVHRLQLEK